MSFSEFLIELMRLLDGDEASPTDLPLGTLYQIIRLGERRIYGDVRTRYNEKSFADALTNEVVTPTEVTGNLAPLPDDFESASVVHFGRAVLQPVAEDWLTDYNLVNTAGEALYFAQVGGSLTFGSPVADEALVQGRYYCRLPGLEAATTAGNALFQAEPDLFIYGALAEGAPVFKKFNEIAVWEAKYRMVVDRVNKRHESAAYSAGRMRVRPSTRLMR